MVFRLPDGWGAVTREQRRQRTVADALLRRSASFSEWTSPMLPVATALFTYLLWPYGNHRGLLVWLGIVSASSLQYHLVARSIGRRPEGESTKSDRDRFGLAYLVGGACWGSLPFASMPDEGIGKGTLVSLVISLLAAGLVFAGQYAPAYYCYQLGATILPMLAFSTLGTAWGWNMVLFIGFASVFASALSTVYRYTYTEAVFFGLNHRQLAEDLQRSVATLAHQAGHDSLTGLPNRAGFHACLETAMGLDAGNGGSTTPSLGVLMIDLDRFKLVNDSLGHAAGDELLREVTRELAARTRPDDVLARLGGDEFVVLARGVTDLTALQLIGERLLSAFDQPFIVEGRRFATTASIGATLGDAATTSVSELLRRADAALYRAKDDGRNQCFVYDEALGIAVGAKLDRKAALESALANGRIVPWFQPIVDLRSGSIVAVEALARWIEGDEALDAAEFMPLVAELGLEEALSLATLDDIRTLRRQWDAADDPLPIGINVEPAAITSFLAAYGDEDLTGVAIEITERGIIDDLDAAACALAAARAAGATVALDDFGTGYSALALVARLPLDTVKLDAGLVGLAQESTTAQAIIVGLVELAQRLGLAIVAEGIETVEQARCLLELGVTKGQGFLFSPAVPAAALSTLRDEQRQWATLARLD